MPFPRQINRENLRFLRNRTDFSYKISEIFEKIRIFVDKITKLNELYQFKDIKRKKRNIIEREYSRKSFDRVTGKSIIK